jgi:hypothetical protein
MKKWMWIAAVVALGCAVEAKGPTKLEITDVRDYTRKENDERVLGLEVSFGGADDTLDNYIRIAMRLKDKKSKKIYYAEDTLRFTLKTRDYDVAGYGSYEYQISHPKSQRLKLTAYTVEFGLMRNGDFAPQVSDYDDVESFSELVSSATDKWTHSSITYGKNSVHYVH